MIVVHHLRGAAGEDCPSVFDQTGPIDDRNRFSNILIGQQYADAAFFEVEDHPAYAGDCQRIDAGEGFVEEDEGRFEGERPGDFTSPPFAAGERGRAGIPQSRDPKVEQKPIEFLSTTGTVGFHDFQHGKNVLTNSKAAKDRGLLGKIAQPEHGAAAKGEPGDILPVQDHASGVAFQKAENAVDAHRFACSVATEKSQNFATRNRKRQALEDGPRAETLVNFDNL